MYGGLHWRSNVDWLYTTRREGDEKPIRGANSIFAGSLCMAVEKITEEANNQLLILQ